MRVSGCSKHSFRHKNTFSKWCSEWVSGTKKTGSVPKLTDFFLPCVLKSTFFRRRIEMHKGFESKGHMGRKTSTWKWGNILSFRKICLCNWNMHFLCKRRSLYFYNDLLTYPHLHKYKVINQLWRPPHLEHPKTLQHIYLWWSIDINIYIWTKSYKSAVETPTLRTSKDTTTYIYIYKYI